MARKLVTIGAALAAFAVAAPVAAQSVDDDVKCLLVANAFARGDKDPTKRQLSMATSLFFLGRLDARVSAEQLKAAMKKQASTMIASSFAPTMNGCAQRALKAFRIGPDKVVPGAPPAAAPKGK